MDTSALTNAWRDFMRPVSFPSFWRRLEQAIANGDVRASEEVLEELRKRDDELLEWATRQPNLIFRTDASVFALATKIIHQTPKLAGVGRFRSGADPFVIAVAEVAGATVVTQETTSPKPNAPKIPNVCARRGVACATVHDMVEQFGWSF